MYKSETAFTNALKEYLEDRYNKVFRIETKTEIGVPDLWFGSKHSQGFIECKLLKRDFKDEVQLVKFEAGQQTWHLDCLVKTGRRVLVLCCYNNGIYLLNNTRFVPDNSFPALQFESWGSLTVENKQSFIQRTNDFFLN
jgi:hypothetical protein